MLKIDARDKAQLIDPLYKTNYRFWVLALMLGAIVAWGAVMYVRQLTLGLVVTGLNRPAFWGVYMVNFIFLIGVSMAGTLISSALLLTRAEWRRPITRIAEALTVFGLLVAGLQILFDMGRPNRLLAVVQFGRLQSPLLWDFVSLTTYIFASSMALYLQLLPDIALLRDHFPADGPAWRRKLYTRLALGWRGNTEQWLRLEKAIRVMSFAIIPIGISLHTVTSWIFSTTTQPGWKSTILGPYFVVGAVFSGIGLLLIVMTMFRQEMRLHEYIRERLYYNLSWLFIVMSTVWIYFTYTEHLNMLAWQEDFEHPLLESKLWGSFAPSFWGMVVLMLVAFWILVGPKLLTAAARRVPIFRPQMALPQAGMAVFIGAILVSRDRLPVAAAVLGDPNLRFVIWGLVTLLLGSAAIGGALWFKRRLIPALMIASTCVVIGMWLERWNIVAPTVTHPRLVAYAEYFPTITEIAITAGSFALLALMVIVFFKFFPVVSIWEVSEGRVISAARASVTIPMPETSRLARKLRRWGLRKQ